MSYLGMRRDDRLPEYTKQMTLYSRESELVRTAPISAKDLFDQVDEESKSAGGQGAFWTLKSPLQKFGIKVFDVSSLSAQSRVTRANRLRKALEGVNSIPANSLHRLILVNILNVPYCTVVDSNGLLAGIVVPRAPESCYVEVKLPTGKRNMMVRISDIVSTNGLLKNRTGTPGDPLPDHSKYSLLDSLCQSVGSLHALGLIHADLSRGNILIRWPNSSDPKTYLIDAFNGLGAFGGNREIGPMCSDVFCPSSTKKGEYYPETDVYQCAWWSVHLLMGRNPKVFDLPLPSLADVRDDSDVLYYRHEYALESLVSNEARFPNWFVEILSDALRLGVSDRPQMNELGYAVHDLWLEYGDER